MQNVRSIDTNLAHTLDYPFPNEQEAVMSKKQLLTTKDIALVLGVTDGRARQLVNRVDNKAPEIPSKHFGTQRAIDRKALEEYIRTKCIQNPNWELIDTEGD